MASDLSYEITVSNNKTEKEAINYLMKVDDRFLNPDKEGRKKIMEILNIDKKYSRAFDLVMIKGYTNIDSLAKIHSGDEITLIELKTTKKKLPKLPLGFFFGATESEFKLAEKFGEKYKFCFISLHDETKKFALLSFSELNKIIKTKRVQYQINL